MKAALRSLFFVQTFLVALVAATEPVKRQEHYGFNFNFLRVRSVDNVLSARKAAVDPYIKLMKTDADIAHGVLMGIAVALFLPIGAITIRLIRGPNAIWVHVGCQVVGMVVLIGGFATGVWTSINHDEIFTDPHTGFGTCIFAFFLLQPVFGWLHHLFWKKKGGPSIWTHVHVWFGRVILILAVINGGIGIQYAENAVPAEKGYGALAGIVGLAYIGIVIWWYVQKPKSEKSFRIAV